MEEKLKLRNKLIDIALQWQANFGVAPSITSSISEYDANQRDGSFGLPLAYTNQKNRPFGLEAGA